MQTAFASLASEFIEITCGLLGFSTVPRFFGLQRRFERSRRA
jgi:hypothetical protein